MEESTFRGGIKREASVGNGGNWFLGLFRQGGQLDSFFFRNQRVKRPLNIYIHPRESMSILVSQHDSHRREREGG